MQPSPDAAFPEPMLSIVGDMACALANRPGETPALGQARAAAAVRAMMAFLPRDGIEAMLASHCVLFHTLLTDSAKDGRGGEETLPFRGGQRGLLALNKAFLDNMKALRACQARPPEGQRDSPAPTQPDETLAQSPAVAQAPARTQALARTEARVSKGEGEERKWVSSERMRDWRWGSVCG